MCDVTVKNIIFDVFVICSLFYSYIFIESKNENCTALNMYHMILYEMLQIQIHVTDGYLKDFAWFLGKIVYAIKFVSARWNVQCSTPLGDTIF